MIRVHADIVRFESPATAIAALCERLSPVGVEPVGLTSVVGRVLADPLITDRDSPPCDVTAMDGFAVRSTDLAASRGLPVAGEIAIGCEPPPLPIAAALRVFTGAPIPPGADAVVQREHVHESPDAITLRDGVHAPSTGANIRRHGENLGSGGMVTPSGTLAAPGIVAGLASFGRAVVRVFRRVRVGIIVTGNELLPVESAPLQWQIRDSNGPTLRALLGRREFVDACATEHVRDEPPLLARALARLLDQCDAVFLTGGVSAGDHDHVPDVVRAVGGRILFHRLPMRPGGPVLGAVGPRGQAILGLPGNPLSAAVTARKLGMHALRKLAGLSQIDESAARILLQPHDAKTLHLWWYRLVKLTGGGAASIVVTRGSGDVVSLARSDGFVEIPPNSPGGGPWDFFAW